MKIIVISGFAEFEYARESINLAVSEYLLKPFATKRLLDVALRVKGEMSEEQAKEEEIATLRAQISNNMPALREKFLADLLNGKMTESDFEAKLQFLGLDAYEKRPYQVVVMELHDSPDAPEDKYLLDLQFYQHIEWALKSSSYQFLLLNYYHHQIVAVVFNPDRDLPLCLEKWLTRLRVHLNKDITFGISNCYQALSDPPLRTGKQGWRFRIGSSMALTGFMRSAILILFIRVIIKSFSSFIRTGFLMI